MSEEGNRTKSCEENNQSLNLSRSPWVGGRSPEFVPNCFLYHQRKVTRGWSGITYRVCRMTWSDQAAESSPSLKFVIFYGCTEQLYYYDLFMAEPSFFIDVLCKTKQSALVTKFLPCVGPAKGTLSPSDWCFQKEQHATKRSAVFWRWTMCYAGLGIWLFMKTFLLTADILANPQKVSSYSGNVWWTLIWPTFEQLTMWHLIEKKKIEKIKFAACRRHFGNFLGSFDLSVPRLLVVL